MLAHANRRWPAVINAHLWPYAVRQANELQNATPNVGKGKNGLTPFELFSGSRVRPNVTDWKPFGCPVYVHQEGTRKWDDRAKLGANLGLSPRHARSVSLVLDVKTGLVSPYFHVKHDNKFESVRKEDRQVSIDPDG